MPVWTVCQAAVMIVKNGAMVATVWADSFPHWSNKCYLLIYSHNTCITDDRRPRV